jgi:hypothetical protein
MSAFNGVGERLAIPLGHLITPLAAQSWSSQERYWHAPE